MLSVKFISELIGSLIPLIRGVRVVIIGVRVVVRDVKVRITCHRVSVAVLERGVDTFGGLSCRARGVEAVAEQLGVDNLSFSFLTEVCHIDVWVEMILSTAIRASESFAEAVVFDFFCTDHLTEVRSLFSFL